MKTVLYLFAFACVLALAPYAQANGLPKDEPEDGYADQPVTYAAPVAQPVPVPVPKPKPAWDGFYVGVYGGLNWADDYGTTFGPISLDSNTDDGAVAGAFVGKRLPSVPGLSVEIEGNYRVNDTNLGVTFIAPPPIITLPGQDSTIALMGNLRYEPWREGRVIPYVYAGIGYGQRTVELDLIPILLTFEDTKSDVVWHAGAGFDVKLAEHVKAGLRYEYFDGVDMSQGIGPVAWSADGQNHAVSAVLTFALN